MCFCSVVCIAGLCNIFIFSVKMSDALYKHFFPQAVGIFNVAITTFKTKNRQCNGNTNIEHLMT